MLPPLPPVLVEDELAGPEGVVEAGEGTGDGTAEERAWEEAGGGIGADSAEEPGWYEAGSGT